MIELRNPENVLIEIEKGELLAKVAEFKKKNNRLCQICAAYVNEKFELTYSFVDDETNLMSNIRLVVDPSEEVPSVTEIVPGALFYENEMKELFGVKIQNISLDFQDKLYRIAAVHPFGPQGPMGVSDGAEAATPENTVVAKAQAAKAEAAKADAKPADDKEGK